MRKKKFPIQRAKYFDEPCFKRRTMRWVRLRITGAEVAYSQPQMNQLCYYNNYVIVKGKK